MSIVIGDGNTSRLETPIDLNSLTRHSGPLNPQKQEPHMLSENISSNLCSTTNIFTNQYTKQDDPSQPDLGPENTEDESPTQATSAFKNSKPFLKAPQKRKGRAATMKSKERYHQVEKIYNIYPAKKEITSEGFENNSTTKSKEDKLPKMASKNIQVPTSSSPSKIGLNHRSRFALFSPYTKIKDNEEKDAKIISVVKVRAASQPLVSIIGENTSHKKELPNLLEKFPQIFLYNEKEEVNSYPYSNKPAGMKKRTKSKELPPIYSKKKFSDIQKQYSRNQHDSFENVAELNKVNKRKQFPKRSSQLKFSLIESNTDSSKAYTLETSMNNSFIHPSPIKKDFKRQRSSTEQSDRVSTQPSNKLQSDSFNDNQEIQSFLEVPEKIFKPKLPSTPKKSRENIIRESSELFTDNNNINITGRYRSKSSSRYDNEPTNYSMLHNPPKQQLSPPKPKINKSESLPQNQAIGENPSKFLPHIDNSPGPKKQPSRTLIQERYANILRAQKEEKKLTDDQRYQQLIQNKIEDQFTELFKHFKNKKPRNNKRVQFITEA